MNMMLKGIAASVIGLMTALPAMATTGVSSGTMGAFHVFPTAGAKDFQVTFSGSITVCPGHTFSYVNSNAANYTTIVQNLMSARDHGSTVTINWTTDASGFCQITEIGW
jgi:hypothetical protein